MHLLSGQAAAKLKANRLAWEHFSKFKGFYEGCAKDMLDFVKKYPRAANEESRVDMVKALIIEIDPNIWGLANATLSAEQVAECFARMVVGHEGGGT
jgi:hypothetical protein